MSLINSIKKHTTIEPTVAVNKAVIHFSPFIDYIIIYIAFYTVWHNFKC